MLVGQDVWYTVAGDESGILTLWASQRELEDNCGTILRGHTGKIATIHINKDQDFVYTLGMDDEALIEWKRKIGLL